MPPELYGVGKHPLRHPGCPQMPTLAPWLSQAVQGGTTPAHVLRLQGLTASCPPHELSAHLDETNHHEINRDDERHRYRQQQLLAGAVLCFPLGQKERKSRRERLLLPPLPTAQKDHIQQYPASALPSLRVSCLLHQPGPCRWRCSLAGDTSLCERRLPAQLASC